jgi:hypothetical protein
MADGTVSDCRKVRNHKNIKKGGNNPPFYPMKATNKILTNQRVPHIPFQ